MRFNGPDIKNEDNFRLQKQHYRIRNLMLDGQWRTLREIAKITGDPESSISAQLRHLRKPRFGSYLVERRRRGREIQGLYEYRVTPGNDENELLNKKLSRKQLIDLLKRIKLNLDNFNFFYNNLEIEEETKKLMLEVGDVLNKEGVRDDE